MFLRTFGSRRPPTVNGPFRASPPCLVSCPSPTRARIEPGRAGLGLGPNSGLRAGLAGLVLIGHLYG
jgi:hypothetical protein